MEFTVISRTMSSVCPAFSAYRRWLSNAGVAVILVVSLTRVSIAIEPDATRPAKATVSPLNFFGGSEVDIIVNHPPFAKLARVEWTLSTPENLVVLSGEAPSADASGRTTVRLAVPSVKPGVVTQWKLSVGNPARRPSQWEQTIAAFPRDPWENRLERLKQAGLTLYDPVGKTSEVLQASGLKLRVAERWNMLDDSQSRIVLIGEGVHWNEVPGLLDELVRLARVRGVHVIVLPAAGGAWSCSDFFAAADSIQWLRQSKVSEQFKLLDIRDWSQGNSPPCHGWELKGEGAQAILEASHALHAWPWIDARFSQPDGRLVLCGFPCSSSWNLSPAPRFLLAEMLDDAAQHVLRRQSTQSRN